MRRPRRDINHAFNSVTSTMHLIPRIFDNQTSCNTEYNGGAIPLFSRKYISKRENSELWSDYFRNCAPVSLGEQRMNGF
jgi:hypothetical protein